MTTEDSSPSFSEEKQMNQDMLSKYFAIIVLIVLLIGCKQADNRSKRENIVLNDSENILLKYYDNGRLRYKSRFKFGKLNGEQFYYYPNGKLKKIATFYNYKCNGKEIWYDSLGTKTNEEWYNNDSLIMEYHCIKKVYGRYFRSKLDLKYIDKPKVILLPKKINGNSCVFVKTKLYPMPYYIIGLTFDGDVSVLEDDPMVDKDEINTEKYILVKPRKNVKIIKVEIKAIDYHNNILKKWNYEISI